jgi:hypothetical protein
MPKEANDLELFNLAMGKILRADPVKVKADVNAEIRHSVAERKARGERKRGRKPKSSALGHASTSKD